LFFDATSKATFDPITEISAHFGPYGCGLPINQPEATLTLKKVSRE
jgi:hypothetical protein